MVSFRFVSFRFVPCCVHDPCVQETCCFHNPFSISSFVRSGLVRFVLFLAVVMILVITSLAVSTILFVSFLAVSMILVFMRLAVSTILFVFMTSPLEVGLCLCPCCFHGSLYPRFFFLLFCSNVGWFSWLRRGFITDEVAGSILNLVLLLSLLLTLPPWSWLPRGFDPWSWFTQSFCVPRGFVPQGKLGRR